MFRSVLGTVVGLFLFLPAISQAQAIREIYECNQSVVAFNSSFVNLQIQNVFEPIVGGSKRYLRAVLEDTSRTGQTLATIGQYHLNASDNEVYRSQNPGFFEFDMATGLLNAQIPNRPPIVNLRMTCGLVQ